MFNYLSKLLPLFVYPAGLAWLCLILALSLRNRRRLQVGLLWLGLLTLGLGGNQFVAMALSTSLEWKIPPLSPTATLQPADAIVVLGGGTRSPSPPRYYPELNEGADRVVYAAQLWAAGAAPVILVSGGAALWSAPRAEPGAEMMARMLMRLGVPEDAILREPDSINTYDNAIKSMAILQEIGAKRIYLVTSARHMPRSAAIFAKQPLETIAAPADYLITEEDWRYFLQPDWRVQLRSLPPTAGNLQMTSDVLKEYIGIIVYRLRGWL